MDNRICPIQIYNIYTSKYIARSTSFECVIHRGARGGPERAVPSSVTGHRAAVAAAVEYRGPRRAVALPCPPPPGVKSATNNVVVWRWPSELVGRLGEKRMVPETAHPVVVLVNSTQIGSGAGSSKHGWSRVGTGNWLGERGSATVRWGSSQRSSRSSRRVTSRRPRSGPSMRGRNTRSRPSSRPPGPSGALRPRAGYGSKPPRLPRDLFPSDRGQAAEVRPPCGGWEVGRHLLPGTRVRRSLVLGSRRSGGRS